MELFLTGAAGFAGSHALRHVLAETDWNITCPVSLDHKGRMWRLDAAMSGFPHDRVNVVPCDLAFPFPTATQRAIPAPDYIVNYASQSHVDRSISHPGPFVRNNVNLMLNVLEFARQRGGDGLIAFVQISTDEVHGPCPAGQPAHDEWAAIVPSNPYAASKAAQEAIAVAYWRTYGIPLLLVNCMNIIGEHQDPEKFVPMVTRAVLEGRQVAIHGAPDGTPGSRCWLHARNLADGWLHLIRGYFQQDDLLYSSIVDDGGEPRPERFNIIGEEVDNLTLAWMIAKALGRPLEYVISDFHSQRPGHDLRYAMDGSRMAATGWVPKVSLTEAIERIAKRIAK